MKTSNLNHPTEWFRICTWDFIWVLGMPAGITKDPPMEGFEPVFRRGVLIGPQNRQFWGVKILRVGLIHHFCDGDHDLYDLVISTSRGVEFTGQNGTWYIYWWSFVNTGWFKPIAQTKSASFTRQLLKWRSLNQKLKQPKNINEKKTITIHGAYLNDSNMFTNHTSIHLLMW